MTVHTYFYKRELMIAIMTDWYFDPGYSEITKQELADTLDLAVTDWMQEAYATTDAFLRQRPKRKTAVRCEATKILLGTEYVSVAGEPVETLMVLICERGILMPRQSLVFIGPKPFISAQIDQIMAQFSEQLGGSGIEAEMIEEDLRS